MLLGSHYQSKMASPSELQTPRVFPQWSRTALMTLTRLPEDDGIQLKKTPPEGGGFVISNDAAARVAHLEHSVRFLQEQHRSMLSGLHAEIEALRERNRDLQFQLIFNKESSKASSPTTMPEPPRNNEQSSLKALVLRLEHEVAAAKEEARAAEAKAAQLQKLVDTETEKLREFEAESRKCKCSQAVGNEETGAELRARLAEAERLVRRLRADAERQRRELHCMKNSLQASIRVSGLEPGFGYQNNYHFPPVHNPEFWREPMREDFNLIGARGRSTRRPLTLPELSGQGIHRSTVYANNHTRPRANGYEQKSKKTQPNAENISPRTPEETECRLNTTECLPKIGDCNKDVNAKHPQLKIVVSKYIPHGNVNTDQPESKSRGRRPNHRKHGADHT
ncbi:uncharacterized protein LOC101746896 isoform X2 [Bombyx mori]|uniref:CCDC92/74 N-terminal domain-containing protein n=1 Tax=Bombyx mori TaxID=7091 RepID=A0A8R2DJX1_BOMMO|nr:uncharacterized protein LOC101746896 isoform X2 [Bombyx mori]